MLSKHGLVLESAEAATIRLLTTAMDDKVSVYDLILNSEETVSYFPLSMRPESVG